MPKPHTRILESLPSDRLQIGDCMVDVTTRDISNHSDLPPQRVSLKAIDVLLVLVSHEGKVVSRDSLLEAVWPDTLPADDVVTQAVAHLRKAFGAEHPYIDTIAKHGYRLRAPVSWLHTAESPENGGPPLSAAEVTRSRRPRLHLAMMTTAVALGGMLLAAYLWRGSDPSSPATAADGQGPPSGSPPLDYRRITSAPGAESWPDLSPDGSLVVYDAYSSKTRRTVLMLQTTAPVAPRALTDPPSGANDLMPAWSPDGREIAFFRLGDKGCQMMLVPATGGTPRPIAPCASDALSTFSWHPDGKHLVIGGSAGAGKHDRGLAVIDLASGRRRELAYARGSADLDMSPAYSPDGRWLAFQRNISHSDLWLMPASGGTPRQLTHLQANIYGLAWTPDSRTLVFSGYRELKQQLLRVEIDSGQIAALGIDAMNPTIAQARPALAFVIDDSDSALYRVPVARGAGTEGVEPTRVFASSAGELLPSIAPDGRQLVFVSDRTGQLQLWWAGGTGEDPAGLAPRSIDSFAPLPRHPAMWSADSKRLLAIGRVGDVDGLYEITPAAGRVQRLPVPQGMPTFAVYLPDPARLLVVADSGAGRLGLTLYDRQTTPWQALATIDDVSFARVDGARKRVVFFRNASWGLWQSDLALRNPILLDDLYVGEGEARKLIIPGAGFFVQSRRLVVAADGIHMGGVGADCALRWISIPASTAGVARAPCLDSREGMFTGMSFDATRGQLYFAYSSGEQSDIGLARLPDATTSRSGQGPARQ